MSIYLLIISLLVYCQLKIYIFFCKKYNFSILHDVFNKRTVINSSGVIFVLNYLIYIVLINLFFHQIYLPIFEMPRPWSLGFIVVILTIVSFKDDLKSINFRYRLIIQFLLCFLALTAFNFPITNIIPIKLEFLIVIMILVFFINTFNFYDGLDGMLIISSVCISVSILVLSYLTKEIMLSTHISLAIVLILTPFAFLNFPVAKVFLGDAGSVPIGFLLGITFVDLTINNYFLIALSIFFVPSCDVALTIVKKIYKNVPIWNRLFDYIFLIPNRKYKAPHTKVVYPFLIYNIINIFIVFTSIFFDNKYFLILAFISGIIFLSYCFFFKKIFK